jgi:hypothetical protein
MSNVQSVAFKRPRWSQKKSLAWVTSHGLKPMKTVHVTPKQLRYRLQNPKKFKRFATKKIKKGILLTIGFK